MASLDEKFTQLGRCLLDLQGRMRAMSEATGTVKTDEMTLELVMQILQEMRQEQVALQRTVASYMISASEDARKRGFDVAEDCVRVLHKANIPIDARFVFKMTDQGAEIHVEIVETDEPTQWDKISSA